MLSAIRFDSGELNQRRWRSDCCSGDCRNILCWKEPEAAMGANIPYVEVHAVDHCNNNCRWCHNYSTFSEKKEYRAEDYFSGLDLLVSNAVNFSMISIMGGEPFLHSNLEEFIYKLLARYRKPIIVTTNGFWMTAEDIRAYKLLWNMLTVFKVSRYPVVTKRLGGDAKINNYFDQIKKYNKRIVIDYPNKSYFNRLDFFDEPVSAKKFCWNSDCTALLVDNRMGRCGAGAYMHLAPQGLLTDKFRDSQDMFYDLTKFNFDSFWLWRKRYPLDACAYCSFSQLQIMGLWKVCQNNKPVFDVEMELEYNVRLVSKLVATNDLEGARAKAISVAENSKKSKEVYNIVGSVFREYGLTEDAGCFYKKALEIDPAFLEAARNMKGLMTRKPR
ncbi:radical SAM protein [Solidesulfovibrio sp.]